MPLDTDYESLQENWENEQVNSEREETSTQSTCPALTELQPTLDNPMPAQVNTEPTQLKDENDTPSQRETADMVMIMVTGAIAFHVESGEWYRRQGHIMVMADADSINPFIIRALDKIKGKKYTYSQVSSIKNFIRDLLRIDAFEESRTLLPLKNGVFNLTTNKLEEYDKYQFNWELPYLYKSDDKCTTTLRYLITATGGDRDLISFLLAWMRVLIAGEYTVQKYIELVGDGGTGKSTFLELCTLLVGENNRIVTNLKSLESNRFESANLQGKRLTLITDSSSYSGEVSILKALTGGDVVRNEKKNKQAGNGFKYKGLVMIATNEKIQSKDYTSGLSRRKIPIVFNVRVSKEEKARYPNDIIYEMKKELPGLLNVLLKIELKDAIKLVKYPEGTLEKVKIENELYTNPILAWMNDRLIKCQQGNHSYIGSGSKKTDSIDDIVKAQNSKLYPNYCSWCEEQGKKAIAINKFSDLIADNARSHDIETTKHRDSIGSHFIGLRLRTSTDKVPLLLENVDTTTKNVDLVVNNVDLSPDSAGNAGNVDPKQIVESRGVIGL